MRQRRHRRPVPRELHRSRQSLSRDWRHHRRGWGPRGWVPPPLGVPADVVLSPGLGHRAAAAAAAGGGRVEDVPARRGRRVGRLLLLPLPLLLRHVVGMVAAALLGLLMLLLLYPLPEALFVR